MLMTAFPPEVHIPTAHRPLLPRLLGTVLPHARLMILGMIVGTIAGLAVYKMTTKTHEARGSFLINQLPFGIQDDTSNDSETSRQLVQSLILSVSSEGMKHEVALMLNVPDASLAFTDYDRPVTLSGKDNQRANIEIIATRNSRLGTVVAQSADPEFAKKVVDAVLTKMMMLNQIAGRLEQIDSRLKLNKTEAAAIAQEAASVSIERIKFEAQNKELDAYLTSNASLDTFPAFVTDPTLSNLKTQYILVASDYASIASQSTSGAQLLGKRGELNNLRDQIDTLTSNLAKGVRASLLISQAREASLQKSLKDLEQSSADLGIASTRLAQGFGDFNLRDNLNPIDSSMTSEASVIVEVDKAYTLPRPVKPSFALDMALGMMLGLAAGLAVSQVGTQFRPA